MSFAQTPQPPYYIVAFSNQKSSALEGYAEMAALMLDLAAKQDGFLGVESASSDEGFTITNSFWRDEEAIKNWRENVKHKIAQSKGKAQWYEGFFTRIAKVERDYASWRD